ncbi:hypothetical protein [Burkholderia vietnamiensis]|uniref:hypothetical protein n=1 Tax=Burkholderia vietnamiensis TaxID=60552 RepID=UPI001B9A561B|nr:hypothetical protein [Burkholderia vietnamiensis]MBR8218429.1 hypothetical protein [Burkholderia vietnamiensis]MCA8181212.1 hypothetical protein [Burkholderia vietnamiensis]
MDSAQDKITGEIVEAEQLWLIPVVDKDRYVCRGCGIKLTPAAYRPENVVRPYFTARDGDHKPGCDVDGEKKLTTKGKKRRLPDAKQIGQLTLANSRGVIGSSLNTTTV